MLFIELVMCNAGEAAHQADMLVGDMVAKVNDTDVSRANADLVQSLVL